MNDATTPTRVLGFKVAPTLDGALVDDDLSEDAMRWNADAEDLVATRWNEPIAVEYSVWVDAAWLRAWYRISYGLSTRHLPAWCRRHIRAAERYERATARLAWLHQRLNSLPGTARRSAYDDRRRARRARRRAARRNR